MRMLLLYLLNIQVSNKSLAMVFRERIYPEENVQLCYHGSPMHLHTYLVYCLISGCEQVDVGLCDLHKLYAGKIFLQDKNFFLKHGSKSPGASAP